MAQGFSGHLRTARIVHELLAPEFRRIVPGALVTIQKVEVTADRHKAVVYYAVMGMDPEQVQEKLESHLWQLREVLAKSMHSKRVPQLFLHMLPLSTIDLACTAS